MSTAKLHVSQYFEWLPSTIHTSDTSRYSPDPSCLSICILDIVTECYIYNTASIDFIFFRYSNKGVLLIIEIHEIHMTKIRNPRNLLKLQIIIIEIHE